MAHRALSAFLITFVVAALSGCMLTRAAAAWIRGPGDVVPLASDSRVHYESGAETLAKETARYLPEAMHRVEEAQLGSFLKPVTVYVYASAESFSAHSGATPNVRGACFNGALFISPLIQEKPYPFFPLLTHELSHLQLQQSMGSLDWLRLVPPWFHEGLAVYVSKSGGAESVSDAQAARTILEGKHFHADVKGSLLTYKGASTYGLEPHMFYRQTGLFVAYLHKLNPTAFRMLLDELTKKKSFELSFTHAYGESIDAAWRDFVLGLQPNPASNRTTGPTGAGPSAG